MWHPSRILLLTLLLVASQTTEQETIAEGCDNFFLDNSYIFCPPGFNFEQADVWFHDKGESLDITCNMNSTAEELEINLARISPLRKKQVNLKVLRIKNCPAPSQSYSAWLLKLGSEVDSLRDLRVLRSRENGDNVNLNSEHFVGLQLLTYLELSGSVEALGPGLLSNLLALEEFIVRYKKGLVLTSVHKHTFKQNKNLKTIRIQNSAVSKIDKDTFKGVKHLETLDLGHNNISIVPEQLLSDLPKLEKLFLRHNSISTLPQNLLLKNPNLKMFTANCQRVQEGEPLKIPARLFQYSANLEYLHLQGNSLKTLPDMLLKGLTKLKVLELKENNLTNSAIGDEIFKDLDSLEEINLDGNKLMSPFTQKLHLVKDTMKIVKLRKNLISTFESEWAEEFLNLQYISLENNQLKGTIHQSDFLFKRDGKVQVKLQGNQIDRLILDQKTAPCANTIVKLDLKNNPITCDCFAYDLLPIMASKHYSRDKNSPCFLVEGLERQACSQNGEKGLKLTDISPDSLTCPLKCENVMEDEIYEKCQCSFPPKTSLLSLTVPPRTWF